ncbi:hypothetical protein LK526_21560, partial [[Clostridium] innocuum]|uniref:hypothetical protein n=1 Tax=Clostridium innocuum TaxID=1522 RepID=UPI001E5C90FB
PLSLHKLYERVTTKLYSIPSKIANHYRSKILEVPCLTKKADIKPAYRPHEQIMGKKGDTIIK